MINISTLNENEIAFLAVAQMICLEVDFNSIEMKSEGDETIPVVKGFNGVTMEDVTVTKFGENIKVTISQGAGAHDGYEFSRYVPYNAFNWSWLKENGKEFYEKTNEYF